MKYVYYDFNPGIIEPTTQNSVQPDETKKYALESAAYFGADYKVSNNLSFMQDWDLVTF